MSHYLQGCFRSETPSSGRVFFQKDRFFKKSPSPPKGVVFLMVFWRPSAPHEGRFLPLTNFHYRMGVSNFRWGFRWRPIAKNQKEGSAFCKRENLPTPPCLAKSVQPQGGNKWNWPTIQCKLASSGPKQNIGTGGVESEYYQIKCTQVFDPEIVA